MPRLCYATQGYAIAQTKTKKEVENGKEATTEAAREA